MNNVMLDLETMGVSNNALIVSIGACFFNPLNDSIGKTFYTNINMQSAIDIGCKFDANTIKWWMHQTNEARIALFKHTIDICDVLHSFNSFINLNCDNISTINIWSHVTFDHVILEETYRKAKIKPAFHYTSARDIRTLTHFVGYIKTGERIGIHHNALDDCLYQVTYVSAMIRKLNETL